MDKKEAIEELKKRRVGFILGLYDAERIGDRKNAERLIDSYRYAIELLTKEEEKNERY